MKNYVQIGALSGKTDIKGFVHIHTEPEVDVKWKKGIFLQIQKDGLFVPFQIEEFYLRNEEVFVLLKLFYYHHSMEKWKNCDVWMDKKYVRKEKSSLLDGYAVMDLKSGKILGNITAVRAFGLNTVAEILTCDNQSILIPFHEDIISEISDKQKTVIMNLPDGIV